MKKYPMEPIRVSDEILQMLIDEGLIDPEPLKPVMCECKKEDIVPCTPKEPKFQLHFEKRYINIQ